MDEIAAIDLSLRLLDWYREMGVDAAVGDEMVNWCARGVTKPGAHFVLPLRSNIAVQPATRSNDTQLAAGTTVPPPRAPRRQPVDAQPAATRAFVAPPPEAAIAAARATAGGASTLDDLGRVVAAFDGCSLKATAKSLCFYRGAPRARLMIIGEAPGREDDLGGSPFLGPGGTLLDKMLDAIGLSADAAHITNAVYWRPPGNRTPTPQELEVCRPFIERQLALVAPEVLLLLGASAAKQVLDVSESLIRARGIWRDATIGGHAVRAMVTYHPNYLLKMPAHKQLVWRDMQAIKAALAR